MALPWMKDNTGGVYGKRIQQENRLAELNAQLSERKRLEAASEWHKKQDADSQKHLARNRKKALDEEISMAHETIRDERRQKLKQLLQAEYEQYEKELDAMGLEIIK